MHLGWLCGIPACACLFRSVKTKLWTHFRFKQRGIIQYMARVWQGPAVSLFRHRRAERFFQLFDQTCHLELRHTRFQKAEGGGSGARRMRTGVVFHSLSLKVSRAPGVSLSLTGDQLRGRQMITASFAVTQPSHISRDARCLLQGGDTDRCLKAAASFI